MVVTQLVEWSFRSRDLHFESSHWQILFTIKCIEKRTGIAHFLKRHWELFHLLGSILQNLLIGIEGTKNTVGLLVMAIDSCSRGREFESQYRLLDG